MQHDMTKGKILPLLLAFTLPLFIGNVFQQLYNMADTVIVGRFVGANALAAVGSTGTLMFLIQGFANGITAGFAILTSQKFGAGDENGVKRSFANGNLLALIVTAILTVVSVTAIPTLLRIMNTPEDIFADARTYITIISAGLISTVFYNMLSAFLRAVGNSRAPLIFLVISACLNVLLDLVLIINFHMGVAGAAYATIISQGISAMLSGIYIVKNVRVLVPKRKQWRLYESESRNQLKMGIPMALQFAITASGTMIMQSAINLFGSTAVASFTAASKVQNLVTQGMLSIGQTMAAFSGQNFGVMDTKRIRKGCERAVEIMIVYSLAAALALHLLLPVLIRFFFSGDVDLSVMLSWGRIYTNISMIFYIPLSLIFIFRNAMQGCGYSMLPMIGGVVELVARLIGAVIGIRLHSYPISVACDPAAWLCTGIYVVIAFLWVIRDIERKMRPAEICL